MRTGRRLIVAGAVAALLIPLCGPASALPLPWFHQGLGGEFFGEHYGDWGRELFRWQDHWQGEEPLRWEYHWQSDGPKKWYLDEGWSDNKKWFKDPDCDPPTATPEPATLLLVGTSLAGLGFVSRRRQSRAPRSSAQR